MLMKHTGKILLLGWIILLIWSYVGAYDLTVWWAEMPPIMLIVIAIVLISRKFTFSPLAYILMAVLIYLHTIVAYA